MPQKPLSKQGVVTPTQDIIVESDVRSVSGGSITSYQWAVDGSLDLSTVTKTTSASVLIPAGTLKSGFSYQISLTVTDSNNKTATSTIQVAATFGPSYGSCSVSPSVGDGSSTLFSVICADWDIVGDDAIPMQFSFYWLDANGKKNLIAGPVLTNYLSFTLPAGAKSIAVDVSDGSGTMATFASGTVAVTDNQSTSQKSASLDAAIASGDLVAATSLIKDLIASLANLTGADRDEALARLALLLTQLEVPATTEAVSSRIDLYLALLEAAGSNSSQGFSTAFNASTLLLLSNGLLNTLTNANASGVRLPQSAVSNIVSSVSSLLESMASLGFFSSGSDASSFDGSGSGAGGNKTNQATLEQKEAASEAVRNLMNAAAYFQIQNMVPGQTTNFITNEVAMGIIKQSSNSLNGTFSLSSYGTSTEITFPQSFLDLLAGNGSDTYEFVFQLWKVNPFGYDPSSDDINSYVVDFQIKHNNIPFPVDQMKANYTLKVPKPIPTNDAGVCSNWELGRWIPDCGSSPNVSSTACSCGHLSFFATKRAVFSAISWIGDGATGTPIMPPSPVEEDDHDIHPQILVLVLAVVFGILLVILLIFLVWKSSKMSTKDGYTSTAPKIQESDHAEPEPKQEKQNPDVPFTYTTSSDDEPSIRLKKPTKKGPIIEFKVPGSSESDSEDESANEESTHYTTSESESKGHESKSQSSESKSKSQSHSKSKSQSHSKSQSKSQRSDSASRSKSKSKSGSGSDKGSGSEKGSGSDKGSGKESGSRSRSRSRSHSRSASRSRSQSGSRSRSGSRSPSGSRKESGSGSRHSASGSHHSGSGSHHSGSGSHHSGSASGSRSRSGSGSGSGSGSKSGSHSGSEERRSDSK
eukprot:TRINITY_DN2253_c0_g1_i3.p1 TRINITY_DN2253_c0_g1~~TRINITY_DN2253_c0_g1_i3.p1  ORF type:complete len:867 (+),score=157.74 TRINITY_DN2253_c0_g1_i3:355-2955(+)